MSLGFGKRREKRDRKGRKVQCQSRRHWIIDVLVKWKWFCTEESWVLHFWGELDFTVYPRKYYSGTEKVQPKHIRATLGIKFRANNSFTYMACLLSLLWGMNEINLPSSLYPLSHQNQNRFDRGSVLKVFLTTTNVLTNKKMGMQRYSCATTLLWVLIQDY